MSARLVCVAVLLAALCASGCCWCHRWHRHCGYAPAGAALPGR
jgi:hypothetical protein